MAQMKRPDRLSKEALDYYLSHTLQIDDTFTFDCKMCGSCCRKREEPIVMTGVDVFFIAKALGVNPAEVAQKYLNWNIGPDSKLPIATLRERLDGSCVLMRKSKCTIQNMKPVVGAIFPLGRMLSPQTGEYQYFFQPSGCAGGSGDTKHTLREWLSGFGIEERDEMARAWTKLFTAASICMRGMKHLNPEAEKSCRDLLVFALYLNYSEKVPYIEAVQKNAMLLEARLPKFKMPDWGATKAGGA